MKIALALIVKGTEQEAKLLDRLLTAHGKEFDGIYVTSTYTGKPEASIDKVCEKHGASVSYFKWVNDFAEARNFNFSQVPREYDYIMWLDADDLLDGARNIRAAIEKNPQADCFYMWYYYEFDKDKNPTIVHKKNQILRNDGCVSWVGRIHEDFKENRSINAVLIEQVRRIHNPPEAHFEVVSKRNLEIAKLEAKDNPKDPVSFYNLGNAFYGNGQPKEARKAFNHFLKLSSSDSDKYLIAMRLADVEALLGSNDKAITHLQQAIGMFPEWPDAFHQLGKLYAKVERWDDAARYFMIGLTLKPQHLRSTVFNPRDYDYNPMKALAYVFINQGKPHHALPLLKGCLKLYPNDKKLEQFILEIDSAAKRLDKVIEVAKYVDTLGDNKEKILYHINKLDKDLQSHPAICRIRNQYEIKEFSSGKDIAYYCGETNFEWNPELFKIKGFGGSEEAVINLTKQWAKQGYNVTVYNSCGMEPMIVDGVTYKPFWMFNGRDKWDYLILWRHPKLADYELGAKHVILDLHDVLQPAELTEKRIKRIDKIMVKTKAHRALFPKVSDGKFLIVPNGQDNSLFTGVEDKDPMLLVNTSSPDRSMDTLPELFKRVKEQVPEARLKWAYGWNNFDSWYKNDKEMMDWKNKVVKGMEDAGIEVMGRLPQSEVAKLYEEGSILAYPSTFYEIDCISLKKAQAVGCIPVTTDFAAFDESNKYGVKVHSSATIENWCPPGTIGHGLKEKKAQDEWVKSVVSLLKSPCSGEELSTMKTWSKQFDWDKVSDRWIELFDMLK